MNILFLTPPERRPYEFYYFSNFKENNIFAVLDERTFQRYEDWFSEFDSKKLNYIFLDYSSGFFSKFFHGTAAEFTYNINELEKLIKEKDIKVIVSVELFSFLTKQASYLSRKFNIIHIIIVWENIVSHPFYKIPPYRFITTEAIKTFRKIIAVSDKTKQSLIELGIKPEKIEIIYPGIFLENFNISQKKEFDILFVGHLEKHKGFDILLEAFRKISDESNQTSLCVVGDGSLMPKTKNIGDKYKIKFMGNIPHEEVFKLYSKSKIFCLPSLKVKKFGILIQEEQFGFSLIEAMASGLPIISTNVGAIPEIIGNDNIVVEPKVESIYNGIKHFLENKELCDNVGKKNRKRCIEYFDTMKQSQKFEKILNDVYE